MRRLTVILAAAGISFAFAAWADGNSDASSCYDSDERSDLDTAIEQCSRLLEFGDLSPEDSVVALYKRGNAYSRKGEYDRAIQDYDQAVQLKPDDANIYHNRGVAYDGEGNHDRAIQDLDRAISLNPDDPQSYYNRANAYYGKEEYQQAIKDFDEAIRLQPDYYDAYDNRGLAYGHMGEYARAVRDFGKATALDPNRPNAYFNRSTILARTGDYDGALKDLAQVIRLTPDDADTYYNRAIIYHRKGEDDRSIEDLDHAIRLNPDHAGAYYNRGLAYSGKHDYDRAIQDFSQAIRLRPNDADGYYNRGVNYDDKGDYDLAIQDFDQAFRLRPKDLGIDLSWDVGRAFFGLARFPDATEVLAVSARAHPKDAYVVLWLYLARQRSHAGGGQELNAEAKNLELDKWPGPIVRYYQGLISKEATLTAAADPNPNTAGRQNCEVAFYIGEVALIAGRTAEAKTSFRHALDICASGSVELGGTKAELGRLESW